MKTIWKYQLHDQSILMPWGAQVLAMQAQNDQPCLWAVVDTGRVADQVRRFLTYGTGHRLPDGHSQANYVGTYQLREGASVFHVFEA